MADSKSIIKELFESAGIQINGFDPWDIRVLDDRFYRRILQEKSLGLGESYMDGWWECDQVDEFILRLSEARLEDKVKDNIRLKTVFMKSRLFNHQTVFRALEVVQYHYNLDNNLFFSFLDPYKQYSCACFSGADTLSEAQVRKLDLISQKLHLKSTDHVLDIGSGWGGLAKYMAEHYGCRVTGINISREQIKYSHEDCHGLPVSFVECDYRKHEGQYDKIVSVGMFEHVGPKNYVHFIDMVKRCLKPKGIFLLHTIGSNATKANFDPWLEKYIFPNAILPSVRLIAKAVEDIFVVEDLHNLGPDYDRTLMAWYKNFTRAWPRLKHRYNERFRRMWDYYLLSCAGAFRARVMQVWQIVMTHQGALQPPCRFGYGTEDEALCNGNETEWNPKEHFFAS